MARSKTIEGIAAAIADHFYEKQHPTVRKAAQDWVANNVNEDQAAGYVNQLIKRRIGPSPILPWSIHAETRLELLQKIIVEAMLTVLRGHDDLNRIDPKYME